MSHHTVLRKAPNIKTSRGFFSNCDLFRKPELYVKLRLTRNFIVEVIFSGGQSNAAANLLMKNARKDSSFITNLKIPKQAMSR